MVTPFSLDGSLDVEGLRQQLGWLSGRGMSGFVALGSTGEAPLLSREERRRVIESVVSSREEGGVVIAGVGVESTGHTIELARDAAEAGADAALVVNPSYYRSSMTEGVLRRHYLAVADSSPIPLVLYSIPQNTGISLSHSLVEDLSAHANIIGLKESGGDMRDLQALLGRTPPEFSVITGAAALTGYAAAAGAAAAILAMANVVPALCVELFEAGADGDMESVRGLQPELNFLTRAIQGRFGIPGLKAAAEMAGGHGGAPRAPLLPLTEDERSAVAAAMEEAGLLPGSDREEQ